MSAGAAELTRHGRERVADFIDHLFELRDEAVAQGLCTGDVELPDEQSIEQDVAARADEDGYAIRWPHAGADGCGVELSLECGIDYVIR